MALTFKGAVHYPKQLNIDQENSKLYCYDRGGMRVMRSNSGDSDHEILIQTSDWKNKKDAADLLNWCVGVFVNNKEENYIRLKAYPKLAKTESSQSISRRHRVNLPQTALISSFSCLGFSN